MGVLGLVLALVVVAVVLFGMLGVIEWLLERRVRARFVRAAPWEPTPRAGCVALLAPRRPAAASAPGARRL